MFGVGGDSGSSMARALCSVHSVVVVDVQPERGTRLIFRVLYVVT
jgi:hypothetical protein